MVLGLTFKIFRITYLEKARNSKRRPEKHTNLGKEWKVMVGEVFSWKDKKFTYSPKVKESGVIPLH